MARPTSSTYVHRRIVVAVVCVSARCHRLLSPLPMTILRGHTEARWLYTLAEIGEAAAGQTG
jgi:hypothetical protein